MSEFIQMNVFFLVTTVAVVFLTGLAGYILWRVARILRSVDHISEQVSLESDIVRTDIASVRADIRAGKGRLQSLFNFFGSKVKKRAKKN